MIVLAQLRAQGIGLAAAIRLSLIVDEMVVARRTWVYGGVYARFQTRMIVVKGLVVPRDDGMPQAAPGAAA